MSRGGCLTVRAWSLAVKGICEEKEGNERSQCSATSGGGRSWGQSCAVLVGQEVKLGFCSTTPSAPDCGYSDIGYWQLRGAGYWILAVAGTRDLDIYWEAPGRGRIALVVHGTRPYACAYGWATRMPCACFPTRINWQTVDSKPTHSVHHIGISNPSIPRPWTHVQSRSTGRR